MKFCSITPPYPVRAYIVSFFLQVEDQITLITLSLISQTPEDIVADMQELVEHVEKEKENDQIQVMESCLVIPITYAAAVPLKKKYWANPSMKYSGDDRQKAFIQLLNNTKLYQLLVLPYFHDKETDKWQFSATIPLLAHPSPETIERFMMTSDAVVDQTAKTAALYDLTDPIRFNWKTKKAEPIFEKEDDANKH